ENGHKLRPRLERSRPSTGGHLLLLTRRRARQRWRRSQRAGGGSSDEPLSHSTGAHISARAARGGLLSISRWLCMVPERCCYVVISNVRSAFGPLAPKLCFPILRRGLVLGFGKLVHLADVF